MLLTHMEPYIAVYLFSLVFMLVCCSVSDALQSCHHKATWLNSICPPEVSVFPLLLVRVIDQI